MIGLAILVAVLVLVLVWLVQMWCHYAGTDEVIVTRWLGKPFGVYPSGQLAPVPLCPGVDYVRTTTNLFVIPFVSGPKDVLISADGQSIDNWEATVYVILPHVEAELKAVEKLFKAGVFSDSNTTKTDLERIKARLAEILEDTIVPALSQGLSLMNYNDIASRKKLGQINDAATMALRKDPKGVLQRTGIAGSNPKSEKEGTGSISMTIEHAYSTQIQGAMADARSADAEAEATANKISSVDRRMTKWLDEQRATVTEGGATRSETNAELIARLGKDEINRQRQVYLTLALSEKGSYNRQDFGGPDGSALKKLRAVGGAGAFVGLGDRGVPDDKRRDNRDRGPNGGGKKDRLTDEQAAAKYAELTGRSKK